jgi:ribulose-phosphate 3-epimerase
LTFHPEVSDEQTIMRAFNLLHEHNVKCGIALKHNVDANKYKKIISMCDYVCVMSVEPGKGGQTFMNESIDNLKKVIFIKVTSNPELIIQLDGGVNIDVMKYTYQYVDHFIIGSFLMKQSDKKMIFEFAKNLD